MRLRHDDRIRAWGRYSLIRRALVCVTRRAYLAQRTGSAWQDSPPALAPELVGAPPRQRSPDRRSPRRGHHEAGRRRRSTPGQQRHAKRLAKRSFSCPKRTKLWGTGPAANNSGPKRAKTADTRPNAPRQQTQEARGIASGPVSLFGDCQRFKGNGSRPCASAEASLVRMVRSAVSERRRAFQRHRYRPRAMGGSEL